MRRVAGSVLARWLLTLLGTLLLAAVVWFFGPFISFLEGEVARAVVIIVMLLLWAGINFWIDRRRRGRDEALAKGVTETQDPTAAASAEEVAALREKLSTSLALLRKARGTRGYLYEQPWYVIIGPPGAGKTTALLNAGLRFPLAAEMGQGPAAGVGGTRLCDWWFTEQAVLIDTAGRYTTQDSDSAVDRAGWEGFLDLLKRSRARQPLNGVLVAIAVSDIAAAPREERLAHARAIRRRIKEISERLGTRVPVYSVLTKADLIAGFTEFFDDLDSEKRAQVWGTTFGLEQPEAGPLAKFLAEFHLLVERLNARLLERLQAERSPERRALLAGFPAQVASLEQPLSEFLQEAFGGSRLDPAPFLRGVYMTSGTQEGTPIDRLTGVLARAFGVDQRSAPSLRPQQGRSYFLRRLLTEVVFGEAMLASRDFRARRQRLLLRSAAYAAAVLAVLLVGGGLWRSRAASQQSIDRAATALADYTHAAQSLKLDPVADADMPRVVPVLDKARALPVAMAEEGGGGLGLSQTGKLVAGGRAIYRNALGHIFLPRLVWRLESQMRGNVERPDFLYQATRVYLMLGGQGPLDRSLVRAWMTLDWEANYPDAVYAPMRASLARHLDALMAQPLPPIELDGALVAEARTAFSRIPLADRVYSRIRPSAAAQALPQWTPAAALGPAGVGLFLRKSGKPLTEGIPGFYTVDGFYKVLLPALGNVSHDVAEESWVLGQRAEVAPESAQMLELGHGVIALYEKDYARHWDAMLDDLEVVPLRSLPQAVRDLYILSSPQSPMKDLLSGIARQLTLTTPPGPAAGLLPQAAQGAVAGAAAQVVPVAVNPATAQLQSLLKPAANGLAPAPPGKAIDDRYKPLREFVGSGPGAPIDAALKLMNDMQQQLAKLSAAAPGSAPPAPSGEDPAQLLRAEAARDPQPVARWLVGMSVSGTGIRGGGARQMVKAALEGAGGPAPLCRQAVTGRYPFTRGASQGIPLDDFGKLFAPGGLLDGFVNSQLRPYVDTSSRPWRALTVDGVAPVNGAELAPFQRAAEIRDLFFVAGGTTPSVRLDITPVSLDDGAKQVSLDLGGTTITYAHGPTRATQITWPAAGGQDARLVFDPPPASGSGAIQESGPWALFRLFDRGHLQQQGSADRYLLAFQLGERQASFEIRAGSVRNPLAPGTLAGFRCPSMP